MKSNTFFHILESCSAHHFIKLFFVILRCGNKKSTIEVL